MAPKRTQAVEPDGPEVTMKNASHLKAGDFIMIEKKPCEITEVINQRSSRGSETMVGIRAEDIFTNEKLESAVPASRECRMPVVYKATCDVRHVSDGRVDVTLADGRVLTDVPAQTRDLARRLTAAYDALPTDSVLQADVVAALGREMVVAFRVA